MGKDKDTPKKNIMPSTTRGGKDLPSRPHFSPHATTGVAPAIRKNKNALPKSSLSQMSIGSENELSGDDTDEVGTPVSSRPFSEPIDICDSGEFGRALLFFLISGVTAVAACGEKCGLEGKSLPPRVVEGIIVFLGVSLSFPMMRNK